MKRHKTDYAVWFFDGIIAAIGKLLTLPFRRGRGGYSIPEQKPDRKFIENKWSEIQELLKLGGPSRFKQAVIEADKLLDLVLKSKGIRGENMGERLKNARDRFSWNTYQGIWQAHKIRNEIVHQSDRDLLSHEAKDAIEKIREGLEVLRVL